MRKPCQNCTVFFDAGSCEKYCSLRCMILARTSREQGECWLWRGYCDADGYGVAGWRPNRIQRAHRLAYEAFVGEPGDKVVCHTCDVPRCCNPGHLFLGTQQDNIADCKRKRRHPRGVRHVKAKLSEEKVREIRRLAHKPLVRLAEQFGVSHHTIRQVIRRETWVHVE